MAEWVAAVGGVLAAIIAMVALGVSLRAKEIAETANDVARDANQISEDANTIAERALRVSEDHVPYNWVLKVRDDGTAVVRNDCGYGALRMSLVLDSGGQVVAKAGPLDVEPFGDIVLDAKSAVDSHFENVRSHPATPRSYSSGTLIGGGDGDPVAIEFRAHLRWHTEEDTPRADVAQQVVCHQMTHDGLQRISPL